MMNQTLIKSGCYSFELPLHRKAGEKWKPYPIFHGSTAALKDLSCHVSTLVHGFSPHPPHEHKQEEILFVLSGEVDIILKDHTVPDPSCFYRKHLQKNQFAYYPANFAHSLETTSKEPANYLMFRWYGDSFSKNNILNFLFFNFLPPRDEADSSRGVSMQLLFEKPTEYLEKLHCHTTHLAPGAGYAPHTDSYDVAILLLEGEVQTLGQNIKAPVVIFYETGKPHGILNPTACPAQYLVFEFHRHSSELLQETSSINTNKNIKPPLIMLDASSACQLKCPSCPTGQGMTLKTLGAKFLKFVDFKNLIDANPWISDIELSNWGEIFLNPEIISILEYGFKKNIALHANCGVNLNTVSNYILEALVKYQFRGMTVSLDGASNDTYKIYRVGGDFEKVIAHIRIINSFKQRYKTDLPKMTWQFVAFGHNEHEIAKARDMAAELKMDFYVKLSFGDLYTGKIFSPIKNRELIRKECGVDCADRQEYFEKHGERYLQKTTCAQLWKNPQIHADGRLLGCSINYQQDYGNVFEEGLLECINNEKMNYARQMLLGQKPPREDIPCSKCIYYQTMRTNMDHETISTTHNAVAERDKQIAVKNKKGVVYTCITGSYDALIKHTFVDHHWDYVCFTDDLSISNVDNDSWQVRPLFFNKLDNARNQRWHKIHPHILFPEYKKSIWIDANINILDKDVFADIDRAMDDSCLISVAPHPERNCIYDELIACVALGKDDEGVMRKQVDLIKSTDFPEKKGLFETNVIYRDHHRDRVIEIMTDWWWWIENYSRRDQLSLSYVLWQHKLEVKPLTNISYRYSDGIEFINNTSHATKEELIVQRDQLQQAINLRDGQITSLKQALSERDAQIEQITAGNSWKITRPIREIRRWLTKPKEQLRRYAQVKK
jgi:MoaA/NifB/PqqE/SkfB family radical SAM enzyme/mannose-6-phosphate isomerase-like protein (cupin superfamily)